MSTPLRVLFIEDSEDDVLLLTRQLRVGGYAPAFERVETADGLRSALHRGGWEVIISDYSMPRFNGMGFCFQDVARGSQPRGSWPRQSLPRRTCASARRRADRGV